MKVLLHTCCAPCLIYPLEVLRHDGFAVEAYFYNPNIYPEEEFIKRKQVFLDFAAGEDIIVHVPQYAAADYGKALTKGKKTNRCVSCWDMRLFKTAVFAKKNNFNHFTTALLVSPYQDIEAIKNIGETIARKCGIDFLYRDFRPGFREAHTKARAMGIYCQKYCGCSYSRQERMLKKRDKK